MCLKKSINKAHNRKHRATTSSHPLCCWSVASVDSHPPLLYNTSFSNTPRARTRPYVLEGCHCFETSLNEKITLCITLHMHSAGCECLFRVQYFTQWELFCCCNVFLCIFYRSTELSHTDMIFMLSLNL